MSVWVLTVDPADGHNLSDGYEEERDDSSVPVHQLEEVHSSLAKKSINKHKMMVCMPLEKALCP